MGAYYRGGNQMLIGGYTFTYDAERRLKTSSINNVTTTYVYDGEGRRVKKVSSGGNPTFYVYAATEQLAAEYGGSGGGRPLLRHDGPPVVGGSVFGAEV